MSKTLYEDYPAPWGASEYDYVSDLNGSVIQIETACEAHNAMASRLAEVERELAEARAALVAAYDATDGLIEMIGANATVDDWMEECGTHAVTIANARAAVPADAEVKP